MAKPALRPDGLAIFPPATEPGGKFEPPRELVPDLHGAPYPFTSLPPLVQGAVEDVLGATQAPEALVGTCAMGVLSAVGQGLLDVARDAVLHGPTSLYVITLAVSGERKTSVDNLLTRGLRQWEQEMREAGTAARLSYEARMRAWTAEDAGIADRLRKAAAKGEDTIQAELTQALQEHAVRKPGPMRAPGLLRGDDTPERQALALLEWPVRAVISSEAGSIFGSHGMSEDIAMRSLAQYNTVWDGGSFQRGRVGGGDIAVDHTRITLSLQVQPKVFADYCAKSGELATGMGFFARCLITQPESTQGGRFYKPPPEGMPGLTAFNDHMRKLAGLAMQRVDLATGHVRPWLLALNDYPQAKAHWIGFHDAVEEDLAKGRHLYPIQGTAAKAADVAARMWGLFMLCTPGAPERVPDQDEAFSHMLRACSVERWYLDEALRMRLLVDVPVAIRNAQALERYVCERCLMQKLPSLPQRDLTTLGPKATRGKVAREEAVELLVSHGRMVAERDMKTQKVTLWPAKEVLDEYRSEHLPGV